MAQETRRQSEVEVMLVTLRVDVLKIKAGIREVRLDMRNACVLIENEPTSHQDNAAMVLPLLSSLPPSLLLPYLPVSVNQYMARW